MKRFALALITSLMFCMLSPSQARVNKWSLQAACTKSTEHSCSAASQPAGSPSLGSVLTERCSSASLPGGVNAAQTEPWELRGYSSELQPSTHREHGGDKEGNSLTFPVQLHLLGLILSSKMNLP